MLRQVFGFAVNWGDVCRMIGFVSRERIPLRRYFVAAPHSLLHMSLHGRHAPHRHGFGYAWKEGEHILSRRYGKADLDKTPEGFPDPLDLASTLAIGHVRKASPEYSDYSAENAHPFSCSGIYLAHNGGIRDSEVLKHGPGIDSERLTRWLGFHWNPRTPENLVEVLGRLVEVTRDFSSLNFLVTDGRDLYAFCFYSKSPEYYTLWVQTEKDMVIISSEPLPMGSRRRPMANGELIRVTPDLQVARWAIC